MMLQHFEPVKMQSYVLQLFACLYTVLQVI